MKFEDLKLTHGYPLQLQVASATGRAERFSCRLIGCLPGRSVLLSVPKMAGKLIKFRIGQKLVVRFMIDNGIGMFGSVVETQTQDPYPILYLGYPDAVTFKGIRSATRVAVREEIHAMNLSYDGDVTAAGYISDMSITGARIELSDDIAEIGDTLELRAQLTIRDVSQELTLIGVVRSRIDSTENADDGELVSYGLEFTSLPDSQRLTMYAYVFNQMVTQESPLS